jgi:hypothetical protein
VCTNSTKPVSGCFCFEDPETPEQCGIIALTPPKTGWKCTKKDRRKIEERKKKEKNVHSHSVLPLP